MRFTNTITRKPITPLPITMGMTVIVKSDTRACFPNGQIVVNLAQHSPELRRKKMELALKTFREYGWSIDDQRVGVVKEVIPILPK